MRNELTIKNMVCDRCIRVVKEELEKLNVEVIDIRLGQAVVENLPPDLSVVKNVLKRNGFELIADDKDVLAERIKTLIINHIHYNIPEILHLNYSDYLAQEIGKNYQFLSKLFSIHEGITIEKYIIRQKIEKAKELISYNKLSLSEISYQLGYSSVAYLSAQFKQVTGLSPTEFKNLMGEEKNIKRKGLDKVIE